MAAIRARFEKELKNKLTLKSNAHQSEETILKKSFKYFDLDNSGQCSRDEFQKAVEKIGVIGFEEEDVDQLFDFYDVDGSGQLDYTEFTAILFGGSNAQKSPSRGGGGGQVSVEGMKMEEAVEKFRQKLAARGARGIIGLGKSFKIMDDDGSRMLELPEFVKACKDYRVGIPEADIERVFDFFDRDGSGAIDYDELMRGLRGPMNKFRTNLVSQAFEKIDKDGSGILDIDDIRDTYNAKKHPDVKDGKKTEEEVLGEFLDTFETHHAINGGGVRDRRVTWEEFLEYYKNVSCSVDNDQYFELMMNNTWHLGDASKYKHKKAWSNKDDDAAPKGGFSSPQRGGSAKKAVSYSRGSEDRADRYNGSAKKSSRAAAAASSSFNDAPRSKGTELLFQKFRQRLASRGGRGIIGLGRQFKIMDDDNSGTLDNMEFNKAIKDFRVDIGDQEIRALFAAFDRDGNGFVDYDEFIRGVRGPMNKFRVKLSLLAFKKMDKDKSGVLDIDDIKGVYNAKHHPDVKQGKKTEEEVLVEFLDTFEMHHNIQSGGRGDHRVTEEEWMEYYNNISASIDDDKYFELMMTNTWKLDGDNPQKQAWAGSSGDHGYNPDNTRASWKADMHKPAPYGVSEGRTHDWSTSNRPNTGVSRYEDAEPAAGDNRNRKPGEMAAKELCEAFRRKLASRGGRGMIGLQRQFKIMDDDNSKSLDVSEFQKAVKDFRVNIPEGDVKRLFKAIDRDGSGTIDYDEFLRKVRGPMNKNRVALVMKAYKILDKDGSGVIDINDVKGVYNAKNHPDVKSGKKTEDEVLGEFLDTFEMHHALQEGGGRDRSITEEEFLEYYNNISSSVDDDRYFELMMKNAWGLDGHKVKTGGWSGDYF